MVLGIRMLRNKKRKNRVGKKKVTHGTIITKDKW